MQLVTSTDTNPNEQLSAQLSLLGLYAAPTIGDGNCLFRALADQVYGSAALHAQVRSLPCFLP
jgi:OTU domain-containing protein 3